MAANSRLDVLWHSTAMRLLSFPAQTCVVSWFGVVDGGSATECGSRRAARLDVVSANFDREAPQTNQSGEHLEVKPPEGRKHICVFFCGQKKHKKNTYVFSVLGRKEIKTHMCFHLFSNPRSETRTCYQPLSRGNAKNTYVF